MTTLLEWQFGGWLRALPAGAAWSALAAVALFGMWLVIRSYRRTSGNLSPVGRSFLLVLRGLMLFLLLLCLANPTRVDRRHPESSRRELAVLVDRSASMDQPDHRGTTRLAEAVRVWKQHEAEAVQVFSGINHFRFANGVEPVSSFEAAVKSSPPGEETHLYSALRETLKADPAAIVCLTDGLDTSSEKMSDAINAATERNVPLYFVVGSNRTRPVGASMSIREVKIPARVLRQSRFTATALVEAFSPVAREVSLELWSGDTKLAATNQPVRAGMNEISWPVEVAAGEPAVMPLEFRLGSGAEPQIAGHTTRVVANTTVNLLYYQGALQWGYRFLRGALESDPSFRVTAILNPALGVQLNAGSEGQSTLTDLPEDARELKRFQIVVLANAFADLLTPKQQQALLEYARSGGGVLFISPNNEATRRFSGTPLEQLLPVVFEPPGAADSDEAGARFQEQMRALGSVTSGDGMTFPSEAMASQTLPELVPFQVAAGAAAKLFHATVDMPRFSTYARVRAVKPVAEILVVHPTERSPVDNSLRVLVARQQFGDGFTAAMNTDLLWRWKLSLPSTNHSPEIFWQQFFLSLAQPIQTPAVELIRRTESPQLNRPVTLRITGAAESVPTLVVRSPQGKTQRLTLAPVESEGAGAWETSFIPDAEGCWEANADAPDGDAAKLSIPVVAQARTAEMMNLPPDVDGLRQLAEATGGALIESDRPAFNQFALERPGEILRTHPLWNSGWIVALLLGGYVVELLVRRKFGLL
jgi:hypothetical protein